jgi:hypothetical protein
VAYAAAQGWLNAEDGHSLPAPPRRDPVRLALPLLSLVGLPEPLRLNNMGFDEATVDAVLERLAILRGQR